MSEPVQLELVSMPAREEDVATIDGILLAFYDVISGPAGQPRQWERDRTLYAPGALFVSTGVRPDSKTFATVMDHSAYMERSEPLLSGGFFEREIHRVTHRFGNVAHVFSTYEARKTPDGPVVTRGVNSIELVHDGKRWWIVASLWDTERKNNSIPAEFLPQKD